MALFSFQQIYKSYNEDSIFLIQIQNRIYSSYLTNLSVKFSKCSKDAIVQAT